MCLKTTVDEYPRFNGKKMGKSLFYLYISVKIAFFLCKLLEGKGLEKFRKSLESKYILSFYRLLKRTNKPSY